MTIAADAGKQGIVGKLTVLNVKAGAVSAGKRGYYLIREVAGISNPSHNVMTTCAHNF